MPFEGIDATVGAAWDAAVARLGKAGVRLSDESIALVDDMIAVNAKGGFAPTEAFAIHRERLKRNGAGFDPSSACASNAAAPCRPLTISTWRRRGGGCAAMDARMDSLDVMILPTMPIVAPRLAELAASARFAEERASPPQHQPVNFFDLCAISLPLSCMTASPGLMLVGRTRGSALLNIAAAVENAL